VVTPSHFTTDFGPCTVLRIPHDPTLSSEDPVELPAKLYPEYTAFVPCDAFTLAVTLVGIPQRVNTPPAVGTDMLRHLVP